MVSSSCMKICECLSVCVCGTVYATCKFDTPVYMKMVCACILLVCIVYCCSVNFVYYFYHSLFIQENVNKHHVLCVTCCMS